MLYQEVQRYEPQLQHTDQLILFDLTILARIPFQQLLMKHSKGEAATEKLKHQIQDTFLSTKDLNQKLGAIILPIDSISRRYFPGDTQNQKEYYTPLEYCSEKYQQNLQIGLKVPLEKLQLLQKINESSLKKVKIFSFDLNERCFNLELPLVRQAVKNVTLFNKKVIFHLNVTIESTSGLKELKKQLIQHNYPLQYFYLQTNFLNMIAKQFELDIAVHWEEVALKYCEAIKKYVPAPIGCLLQYYQIDQKEECDNEVQNGINECISLINRRKENWHQKENKPHHSTGISIPESMLLPLMAQFEANLSGYLKAKGYFDSIILVRSDKILMGKYKSQQIQIQ